MSFKISMLKKAIPTKSYSIVILCLLNTKYLSCTTSMTSRAIGSYFLSASTFSTFTQYMSASHGYSTIGGIEYDDMGKYGEDKKIRKSHTDAANQRAIYGDAHQSISM